MNAPTHIARPVDILEAAQLVGKEAAVRLDGLRVNVRVQNVKQSYGKIRWLVTPLSGSGFKWVEQLEL